MKLEELEAALDDAIAHRDKLQRQLNAAKERGEGYAPLGVELVRARSKVRMLYNELKERRRGSRR